jgi:hypothetical protein
MSEERYAVLSALIDREPVNAEELEAALDDAEGRQVLVDLVRLRTLVAAEQDVERARPAATPVGRRSSRGWRLVAAALLPLVLGLSGGYWWRVRAESRPPMPTRVVQFVPGVDWK